jgi:hypothetical protein
MLRAVVGAAAGVACAVLLIAGLGAWDGFANGSDFHRLPPGLGAAVSSATDCVVFFLPVPAACGAVIGGLAGFGSWLVRPRRGRSRGQAGGKRW